MKISHDVAQAHFCDPIITIAACKPYKNIQTIDRNVTISYKREAREPVINCLEHLVSS